MRQDVPLNPFVVRGVEYTLADDLTVKERALTQGAGEYLLRVVRLAASGEVMLWLEDQAAWLDRDAEIAVSALVHIQTAPALRRHLGLGVVTFDDPTSWPLTSTMPRVPALADRVLRWRLGPGPRRWARATMARHQARHSNWIDEERAVLAERRRSEVARAGLDNAYLAAKTRLRQSLDGEDGDIAVLTQNALAAVMQPLSRDLVVEALTFDGAWGLVVNLRFQCADTVSQHQHRAGADPFRLVLLDEERVRTERIIQLGYVVALAVADFTHELKAQRRVHTVNLFTSLPANSTEALFSLHYDADEIRLAAGDIIDSITRREQPNFSDRTARTFLHPSANPGSLAGPDTAP